MDDKTRQLLDKSQQYLRSAAVLLEVGDYDSCASRAYFAMFYAAQAALLTTNTSVKSRRSIRSAFVNRFVDGGRFPQRAGEALHQAYDLQETADYAQRPVIEEEEAERTLSEAEAFIGSIDGMIPRRNAARERTSAAPQSRQSRAGGASSQAASSPSSSPKDSRREKTPPQDAPEETADSSSSQESSGRAEPASDHEESASEQRAPEA